MRHHTYSPVMNSLSHTYFSINKRNNTHTMTRTSDTHTKIQTKFQYSVFLIVVLPCILISTKLFCQQMHFLLKHKMLQFTLKISLYIAPTCFGPFRPSSGSIRQNLAEVTVSAEIVSKNTSLKLLLCNGNICFSLYTVCVYWVLCGV